tara:strand:+ start:799 stop:987 length:189 start_codon:yes stop_codon:yes gene_type:complete
MGMWDLWQEMEIDTQAQQTSNLEDRVAYLEAKLDTTIDLFETIIKEIERKHGQDYDGDGRIG